MSSSLSPYNQLLMNLIDEQYKTPFNIPRMTAFLKREGYSVTILIFFEGLAINKPNQVWASDITYVRLRRGFIYLVVIMD